MRNNRFSYYSDTSKFIMKTGVLALGVILMLIAIDARAVTFNWGWPTVRTDDSSLDISDIKAGYLSCNDAQISTVLPPATQIEIDDAAFERGITYRCTMTAEDLEGRISGPSNIREFRLVAKPESMGPPKPPVLYLSAGDSNDNDQIVFIAKAGAYYADSEETGEKLGKYSGFKEAAVDGDPKTLWHTEWQSSKPPHPHEIQLDLGSVQGVTGLTYQPRQGQSGGGSWCAGG